MAFFGVTREIIDKIVPHNKADRLEIATLKNIDFQFIIAKNSFKSGDECLYFPIDSLIPDELAHKLGVYKKLSGSQKDRIKCIRLRGEISQGIAGPIDLLNGKDLSCSKEITKYLGVSKYEPTEIICKTAKLITLPIGLSKYDIEGTERNPDMISALMNQPVLITEKLEGSNYSVTWSAAEEKFFVNQRRHTIVPLENNLHMFWKVTYKLNIFNLIRSIQSVMGWSNKDVTLYGEFIGPGIQGNIYKLSEHTVRFFDLLVNGQYVDADVFNKIVDEKLRVPTISTNTTLAEWLNNKTIKEMSSGKSLLNNGTLREGIVIRPTVEQRYKNGRLIVKKRDPIYLTKNEN